jgi:hypothetical protein
VGFGSSFSGEFPFTGLSSIYISYVICAKIVKCSSLFKPDINLE